MKRFFSSFLGTLMAFALIGAIAVRDDLYELRKNFEIFGALYEELAINYVDEVRPGPFMRAGIEAMLSQLDPYTHYYDEADMVDIKLLQQKKLGSVGMNVGMKVGRLTVLAPESDATAYRQGIRTGDIILQIGQTPSDGLTVNEAYTLLMGQPGTTIDILIQRKSERTPRTFVLRRVLTRTRSVSWSGFLGSDSTGAIAYVRLDRFGNRSAREVKRAFRNMNRDVPLRGMILDLRFNPGGILGEAVATVELFVPKGSLVVSTRARADETVREYKTNDDPLFPDLPLIVLINRFSASASEIVAGALQDHDRAVIMGETSFGKGLVQVVRPLPHNTSLKLSVSHYFLPTGRTIQSVELNTASARVAVPRLLEYRTPSGRTVRGGLGVEPDIGLRTDSVFELEEALLQGSAFFLFADVWVARNCSNDGTCRGTDEEMITGFREWLARTGFSPVTDSERILNQFKPEVTPGIRAQLKELRAVLEAEKETQFREHRDRILSHIQAEVRSRVLNEQDRISADLQADTWIERAIDTVSDPRVVARHLK